MVSNIILAVDGGATKTTMTIRTSDGQNLFEKTSTGSNYQTIGEKQTIRVLRTLLNEAHETTKRTTIDKAVFAIAGIDTKQDLSIVETIVYQAIQQTPLTIKKLMIENDAQSCLLGLTGTHPGTLIISGTGAICYGTDGNKTIVRTGGWGHRAGDEGSGYWIGRQIIKSVFRAVDGRGKHTILKDLLFKKLQLSNVDQFMNWLYRPNYTNAQIASVSSVLTKAIELKDEVAMMIANDSAEELSLLLLATLNKLPIQQGGALTVYVNGGIFQHHQAIYDRFQQQVKQKNSNLTFVLCDQKPIEYIVNRVIKMEI